MSAKESLKKLIDAIPNVEDFDAEIGEVTDAIVANSDVTDGVFEERYNKLLAAYKSRFGEMLLADTETPPVAEDGTAVVTENDVTPDISDLDFDGSTE